MINLNDYQPRAHFKFDSFIVGNSNRFAFAACKSVAQSPGTIYNPIFIYGGVGLGKTHLLCAIGNFVRSQRPDAVVVYITIDQLCKELLTAVEKSAVDAFNERFRNVDCILIDDIGFLQEKETLQQELVRFFDNVVTRKKQIAMTSDRPPRELNTLLERLRSRIEGGLIVDIQLPEFETRVAIIQKKIETDHMQTLAEDVVYAIADRYKTNIRELEGAFNKVVAYSSILQKTVTVNHLPDIFPNFNERPDSKKSAQPESALTKTGSAATKSQPKQELETELQDLADSIASDADLHTFFEDVTGNVTETIAKKEQEMAEKEKFRRKIYIWQMKGFIITRLEKVMNSDLEDVRRVFNEYTEDVNRLIELQKNIACMDNTDGFYNELRQIEDTLFDPDQLKDIEKRLEHISYRIQKRFEFRQTLQLDSDIRDFIVSDANRLAFSMAETIISHPAERFNPLFIHGQLDTGKTFLLQAIGNEVFRKHPPLNVCYIHSKDFTSWLIDAIKNGKVNEFVDYYKEVDFLLFDDIQLLRGKEQTQEEFFHVFNALIAANKQIVISADRPPQYLLTFDERLRSRFKSGLVVELTAMDVDAKRLAVINLFNRCNLEVSENLISSIVASMTTNLKDISNVIEQTLVNSAATGQKVTEDMIRHLFEMRKVKPVEDIPEAEEKIAVTPTVRVARVPMTELDRKLVLDWPHPEDLVEFELV